MVSFNPDEFGMLLVAARVKAKMSQTEVAQASGIDQSQISRWERGEAVPSLRYLYQVATALSFKPAKLLP